jgi:hypothetical protein
MTVTLNDEQAEVLREILESQLKELHLESARADVHDFRERLHARAEIVERLLAQLPN